MTCSFFQEKFQRGKANQIPCLWVSVLGHTGDGDRASALKLSLKGNVKRLSYSVWVLEQLGLQEENMGVGRGDLRVVWIGTLGLPALMKARSPQSSSLPSTQPLSWR